MITYRVIIINLFVIAFLLSCSNKIDTSKKEIIQIDKRSTSLIDSLVFSRMSCSINKKVDGNGNYVVNTYDLLTECALESAFYGNKEAVKIVKDFLGKINFIDHDFLPYVKKFREKSIFDEILRLSRNYECNMESYYPYDPYGEMAHIILKDMILSIDGKPVDVYLMENDRLIPVSEELSKACSGTFVHIQENTLLQEAFEKGLIKLKTFGQL